ncbi:uncharacterized protein LOC131225224 [Magnolia sinica]|uniref:uncharacterized protein LOC131225224 n=1 Tax=Magnolia sinica TaxID=86752 RepID=UPI00265A4479|nr:uncharacterized protein LOC131225224 [Magnolia sinica]
MAPRIINRGGSTHHESYTVRLSRRYLIITTVTSTPAVVRSWIYHTCRIHGFRLHKLVVGLGVQWRPVGRYRNWSRAATLQLCVGHRCLIFQLVYVHSVPQALRKFLANTNITFVGIWNNLDAKYLQRDHGLYVHDLLDLRSCVGETDGRWDLKQASMGTLALEFLGISGLDKDTTVGRSDWEALLLDDDQVLYACTDAFVSFEIGKRLRLWEFRSRLHIGE